MEKYNYLIGETKSYLTVIGFERKKSGKEMRLHLKCNCKCGNIRLIPPHKFIKPQSINLSCGCIQFVLNPRNPLAKKRSIEWRAWRDMIARCIKANRQDFERYGGRNIKVCDKWLNSYDAFLEDMGFKPSNDLSLDRIDNSGNYEPTNCRWATRKQQNENRRKRPTGLKYKNR